MAIDYPHDTNCQLSDFLKLVDINMMAFSRAHVDT
jgi:hypothetical protein